MTYMDSKYQKGKIYKIWSPTLEEFYVGSTVQALYKRMGDHRKDAKQTHNQNNKLYATMNEVGVHCFHIELIEEYPCNSKAELERRKGELIRQLQPQLNTDIAGRTAKEYYIDNKERILDRIKAYQQSHKEQITEINAIYHNKNRDAILDKKQEYYAQNKPHILEYQSQYRHKHKTKLNSSCKEYYQNHKEELKQKA